MSFVNGVLCIFFFHNPGNHLSFFAFSFSSFLHKIVKQKKFPSRDV